VVSTLVSTFTDATTEAAMRGAWDGTCYPLSVWRVSRLTDEHANIEPCLQVWGHGIICPGVELQSHNVSWGAGDRVVPGIRRVGKDDVHNHCSPTTPSQAVACDGAHLVVGRPIYEAADPVAETRDILREMGV
jgi:orotidine-5'-phosphate decarboxylase